ncbi:hypothetical protein GPALN_016279 [Globodera pallida]|nr:hypothetical protein GPALN_016279 [Globodera pallida]
MACPCLWRLRGVMSISMSIARGDAILCDFFVGFCPILDFGLVHYYRIKHFFSLLFAFEFLKEISDRGLIKMMRYPHAKRAKIATMKQKKKKERRGGGGKFPDN